MFFSRCGRTDLFASTTGDQSGHGDRWRLGMVSRMWNHERGVRGSMSWSKKSSGIIDAICDRCGNGIIGPKEFLKDQGWVVLDGEERSACCGVCIDEMAEEGRDCPECDNDAMRTFLKKVEILLPIMGFDFLKENVIIEKEYKEESEIDDSYHGKKKFSINTDKLDATMCITDEGFIVKKNSQAGLETKPSLISSWSRKRNKLKENGDLVEEDGYLIFKNDVKFSSASAASSIVLGVQSNGTKKWIDEKGETLSEYRKKTLEDD